MIFVIMLQSGVLVMQVNKELEHKILDNRKKIIQVVVQMLKVVYGKHMVLMKEVIIMILIK